MLAEVAKELAAHWPGCLQGIIPHDQGSLADKSPLQSSQYQLDSLRWALPLTELTSFRDFYAFESHVKRARSRRGLEMIPQCYKFPVFYFSNPRSMISTNAPLKAPAYGQWLDFELEIGCIIGKQGIDITEADAEDYIAG